MDDKVALAPDAETVPTGDRRRYERPQVLGEASLADIVRKSGTLGDTAVPHVGKA